MSNETIAAYLEQYNKWRRGDESIEHPNPKELGEAIDCAVAYLRHDEVVIAALKNAPPRPPDASQCTSTEEMTDRGCVKCWGEASQSIEQLESEVKRLREALHAGLDLCVRARKLDEQVLAQTCKELGSCHPEHVNCGTVHLWVQEQYEKDLASWEESTRKALTLKGTENGK